MLKGFLSYEDRIWNKSPEVPIKIRERQQKRVFKKLKGEKDVYRIRIGDFRVLYRLIPEDDIILVFKVDKRSRVYGR